MAFGQLLNGFNPPASPYNAALDQLLGARRQSALPGIGGAAGNPSTPALSQIVPPGRMAQPGYGTNMVQRPDQAPSVSPVPAPAPSGPAPTDSMGRPSTNQPAGSFLAGAVRGSQPPGPAKAGSDLGTTQSDPYWQGVWGGIQSGSQQEKDLNDYIRFLYSLPDYKGRNEANRAAIALYARNLKLQAGQNGLQPEDLQAISKIGDEYGSIQDQLSAELAARGQSGGVVAGGLTNLAGKKGAAVGDLLANITRQARQERLARQLQQMGFDEQMIQQAVAANRQEQMNKGGFWKDLLGFAGTIGGALIPGVHLGGGGSNATQGVPGGYTDPSGYYGGSSDWFNNPPQWMDFQP